MDAQDRSFLENLPEYVLYQKLLEREEKMIALLLATESAEYLMMPS